MSLNIKTEDGYKRIAGNFGERILASNVAYDNSQSGLQSNDVQGAIDEIVDDVTTLDEIKNEFNAIEPKYENKLELHDSIASARERGYYNKNTFVPNSGYSTNHYIVDGVKKTVINGVYVGTTSIYVAIFFDVNGVYLSQVGVGTQVGTISDYLVDIPVDAHEMCVTTKIITIDGKSYNYKSIRVESVTDGYYSLKKMNAMIDGINHWRGRKVVWLGTSVPYGYNANASYAKNVADALGFTLVNTSTPGEAIHCTSSLGVVNSGSTCLSIAEYASKGITIANEPRPYVPGSSDYNNYYRTWEHIFTEENADADLWVFDVFPNNTDFSTTDWDAFDRGTWEYKDGSSFESHKTTFYGAMLFLLDKLYKLNPEARVIFMIGSAFSLGQARTVANTLATTALHYNTINLWDRLPGNVITNRYLYSLNGTDMHPSTKAHEIMGRMLVGDFLSLA